jgi:broad specificity phosphatase PhoE
VSLIYSIILQINLFFGLFIFSGETDANQKHVLQGQSNYSLNDLGRSQATKAGAKLKAERFDWVYSSDQVWVHFI